MIEITLLGILSSVFAEVITAVNKKLNGTVLQGDGAFLIVLVVAFVGAIFKEVTMPGFNLYTLANWQSLGSTFGDMFAVSQVYFYLIVKKLNLDVQPALPVPPNSQPLG